LFNLMLKDSYLMPWRIMILAKYGWRKITKVL
jgi:hypothetical protein